MKTAEDILAIKGSEVVSVTPEATIREALHIMVAHKIGAILIMDGGRVAGIWTERDLMRHILVEGFDPDTARMADHMVAHIRFAAHDDSIYSLMDQFLGLRFRHLPVEKDGEFIGLLSIGDVLKACLHEKTQEFEELHGMVNWEYYEEWKWNVAPEKREIARGIGRAS